MRVGFCGFLVALSAAAVLAPTASAATLPPNFSETLVAGGLTDPSALALAPGGLIYVAEEGGALRVIQNGTLLGPPFISLTVDNLGERGLIGVTVDPDFASNRFVYVHYTVPGAVAHNRVSRFPADTAGTAAAGAEEILVELDPLSGATNHNGGAIHFGSDGKLYIGVGENATPSHAQSFANRHGKILRVNSDGTIPTNPFDAQTTGANKAIWALGLRNPFTFAFQPGTGRMFVNDVGQNTTEEINDGIAGSNYGWSLCEGPCTLPNPVYRDPIFSYAHTPVDQTTGCAIVGGAFYNPATVQFPSDYVGDYFFADLCRGWIRRLDLTTQPPTAQGFATSTPTTNPVDLAIHTDGSLYYLTRGGGGQLYRVTYTPPTAVLAHSFSVARTRAGAVLRWHAGAHTNLLGFHVYRGRARLARQLLSAARSLPHVFVDRRAPLGAAVYRLEAVLVDGSRVTVATAR